MIVGVRRDSNRVPSESKAEMLLYAKSFGKLLMSY
jgi:hypothetical protein